jgi:hypothetical protein
VKSASISPEQGGDGEELNEKEVEQKKGDEADSLKKSKGFPPKPSSQKKSKATMTKMHIVLTSDDFDFLVADLNDASLEIEEKKEVKQEEMYDQIDTKLQGVQKALQSNDTISTATGEPELEYELGQLHHLAEIVEARLRRAQEETTQSTQALTQVQGVLVEKHSDAEWEKLALQEKFDEEKS